MRKSAGRLLARPLRSCAAYCGWKELDEEAPMRPLAAGSGPHDKREKPG